MYTSVFNRFIQYDKQRNFQDIWIKLQGENRLILGREPFGRVPLYWTHQGQVIWFSSHIQLLLMIVEKPEINSATRIPSQVR